VSPIAGVFAAVAERGVAEQALPVGFAAGIHCYQLFLHLSLRLLGDGNSVVVGTRHNHMLLLVGGNHHPPSYKVPASAVVVQASPNTLLAVAVFLTHDGDAVVSRMLAVSV